MRGKTRRVQGYIVCPKKSHASLRAYFNFWSAGFKLLEDKSKLVLYLIVKFCPDLKIFEEMTMF